MLQFIRVDLTEVTRSDKDSCSIKITKMKLNKPVGFESKSPRRDVPHTDGIQWWLSMYPNGDVEENEGFVGACFNVTGAVKNVHVTMDIQGTEFQETVSSQNINNRLSFPRLADHYALWPKLCDTTLLVCKVRFDFDLRPKCLKNSLFYSCDHVDTDFEFVVGDSSVKAHRQLLTLISPVFQAMFSHDTVEARTGKLTIKDLNHDAVKSAIDFVYGREMTDQSIYTVIDALRFADKYDIKSIAVEYEKILTFNLSFFNFCYIARYAFDCNRTTVMDKCVEYFKHNTLMVLNRVVFKDLPPALICSLLKNALLLPSVSSIIEVAEAHGVKSVTEYYKQLFLNTISLENFVEITEYAWDLDNADLKQKCAEFLNEHRVEVTTMEDFYTLLPTTVQEVMKMAMEIKKNAAKS